MGRSGHRHGVGSECPRHFPTVLAVAAILLLSLGPTDSFAPFSVSHAGTARRRGGGRAQRGSAREWIGAVAGRSRGVGGIARLSGVAEEAAVEAVVHSTKDTVSVANNDMKPFVVVPRRDPRVWFDSIRAAAGPRPEALVELSK